MTDSYLIRHKTMLLEDGQPAYWNNATGWDSHREATTWSKADQATMQVPMDGEFVLKPNHFPRVDTYSNTRLHLHLSPEDKAKVRRGRWRAQLKDLISGTSYLVRGASCGLPNCMCDAVIVKEVK